MEQAKAAEAFCRKCERMLARDLRPGQRRGWQRLEREAARSYQLWRWLARVQDPANVGKAELWRRLVLNRLCDFLGPDAFFAGRMPPPVPDGAPVD